MNKDKEYFINWLEKISLKISLIKSSQNNYKRFFQKNTEEKIEMFKSNYSFWIRYNYECSLILAITALTEYGSHDDDLSFPKFLRSFSEYYENNKQVLMEELIKDKPKYITNFNRPDLIKFCTDDNPIEQERLKNIKNTFEELNIKNDEEILNSCFKILKTIRSKLYAHYTDYQKEIDITHSDLEKIIDTIISVFDNYSYILKNTIYYFD